MFSVGNLYLPYYKWTSNYQLKAQAGFFIRNDKLEVGKAVCNTSNFYISIAARIS